VPEGTESYTSSAKDAEVRVSAAIESVASTRAVSGAQAVALQHSASESAIAAVNQQASESAIRDADIGKATAQLAQDTILAQSRPVPSFRYKIARRRWPERSPKSAAPGHTR